MRSRTPPLAPGQAASDVTVYIVLSDFGPLGHAYCETDELESDEETSKTSSAASIRTHFG